MVFEDRVAKYPGRWTMIKSNGISEIVTLIRNDEPTKEGTPINAATLNELSTVAGAINAKEEAVSAASTAQTAASSAAKSAQSTSTDATSAASSAASAKASADRAAAIVSTDKTLSVEGAPADAKATGDMVKGVKFPVATATTLGGVKVGSGLTVDADGTLSADSALAAYPVGSIYQSTNPISPAALFGGTWQQIASERVLMGASSRHAAGTTVEAGLPDITGSVTSFAKEFGGAFTQGKLVDDDVVGNSGDQVMRFLMQFNASNSNAIYGASSTVQPAAYYVYIWHRVA
nr:MAG TPA: baseplate protein [Caudoviricetes sp.]